MFSLKEHILITRLDNIGDVVVSLPLVGLLRKHYPNAIISFLVTTYTKSLVSICPDIDQVWDWSQLSLLPDIEITKKLKAAQIGVVIHLSKNKRLAMLTKRAGIPIRVGNWRDKSHWFYCNRLVNFPSKRLNLHEAERTLKMLKPLGIQLNLKLPDLFHYIHLKPTAPLPSHIEALLTNDHFNLILHPGSNGHGCEWPIGHFKQLMIELSQFDKKIRIFLTGREQEKERFHELVELPELNKLTGISPSIVNMMGKMTLDEFLMFLSRVDGLIASGTGPLHVSAALGIKTLGLFPPKEAIGISRWAPLGKQAQAIDCNGGKVCRTCPGSTDCHCMKQISVRQVRDIVEDWLLTDLSQLP